MKRVLLIAVIVCLSIALYAIPRIYMQKLVLPDGSMPGNPVDNNPLPDYRLVVINSQYPDDVYDTATAANPSQICLKRSGTAGNYFVVAYVNQAIFAHDWPTGSVLICTVIYLPTLQTMQWTKVVTAGTTAMVDITNALVVPPFPTTFPMNATAPLPQDLATGISVSGTTLQWTAPVADSLHHAATGYKVYLGLGQNLSLVSTQTTLSYTTGNLLPNTLYHWKVVPFNESGDAANAPVWSFTTTNLPNQIPIGSTTVDIPQECLTGFPAGITVTHINPDTQEPEAVNQLVTIHADYTTDVSGLNPGLGMDYRLNISIDVAGVYAINFPFSYSGLLVQSINASGYEWLYGPNATPTASLIYSFPGVPAVIEFYGDSEGDTQPVDITGFNISTSPTNTLLLGWMSNFEVNMAGYHVYRAESDDINSAVEVSELVAATNTPNANQYTWEDTSVAPGQTYYYWLQGVLLSGEDQIVAGPVNATITALPDTPPPVPATSISIYPNPFQHGKTTSISVNVKAGEKGTVTIYNILGQVVKTFPVTAGSHTLKWDGKDCANGIYFARLYTPSLSTTRKLVIVR